MIKNIDEFWEAADKCVPVGEPGLTLHKQDLKIEAQAQEVERLKSAICFHMVERTTYHVEIWHDENPALDDKKAIDCFVKHNQE